MTLDGMTLLVRSEVDACERTGGRASKRTSAPKTSSAAASADDVAKRNAERGEEFLADKLEGLRLSSSGGGTSKVGLPGCGVPTRLLHSSLAIGGIFILPPDSFRVELGTVTDLSA